MKAIIILILMSFYSVFADQLIPESGVILIEQDNVIWDTRKEREPTVWDQYFLELMNHYRANPEEALINNFSATLKQADKWYDANDTTESFKLHLPSYSTYSPENTLISTQVANALGINPPDYTEFDADLEKYRLWRELIETTGNAPAECDLSHLDLIYLIYELESKKENIIITWADKLTKEQILSLPDDLKLKIFNEGIFYTEDLLDFSPKPPLSMDSKLCQSTLNHLKWSAKANYMGHSESEDLSNKLGIPYFGNHSFNRAHYVDYDFVTGQENLTFNAEAHLFPSLNMKPWSEAFLQEHYVMLFVDTKIYERGHRQNLFNNFTNEVGISVVEIDNLRSKPWIATSTNFMQKSKTVGTILRSPDWTDKFFEHDFHAGYISGVLYKDTDGNKFYSVKDEKITDYEVWAEHIQSGQLFTNVELFNTGAYKIQITEPGEYKVYARKRNCLPNIVQTATSIIHNRENSNRYFLTGIKADFRNPHEQPVPAPTLTGSDQEITTKRKGSEILIATAEGFQNKYTWYFVTESGRIKVGEGAELNLTNINIDEDGIYICEITNEGGQATQSFRVNVLDTLILDIKEGWNLISLTRNIPESQLRKINNLSGLNFWFWENNCYTTKPKKEPSKATTFWVNSSREGQIEVHGDRTEDDLSFTTGWSLGGVSESKFITVPNSVQIIYSWDNEKSAYTEVTIDDNAQAFLEEAKGYWIFSL